jgi:hypothetical protein
MPPIELAALAARLGIQLDEGEEVSKETVKKAITRELGSLQSAESSQFSHPRQVVLTSALGELDGADTKPSAASTELVHMPASAFSQMMEVLQKNAAPAPTPTIAPPRPDPIATMRTNVTATATQASTDFTKKRSAPFATAGALIVSTFGLREVFNVGELEVPSEVFYPSFGLAAVAIISGWALSRVAQTRSTRVLRALYNPDLQEDALEIIRSESADHFGQHGSRMFESERFWVDKQWAVAQGDGSFIFNRGMYRDTLVDRACMRTHRRYFMRRAMDPLEILSTIDIDAAADDATGLALDRLTELKIIEPIVFRGRQGFRIIPWS